MMGLFEPSNIYPSTWGGVGNGTIDVNENLTVSWQVNGNTPMTAFSLDFYTNDAASTKIYSTGKSTSGCPFDGVDYKGNVQFFTYTIPSSALTGAGMTNGSAYKMVITQYWNAIDSIVQSSAAAFVTRAKPTVSILNLGSQITGREYAFLGRYTQAQGDTLMWCRWRLALADDLENPIEDTHNIYGTSNLQFDYDGFFTGTTYAIRLDVQTENGIQAGTGWQTFSVSYESSEIEGYVDVCPASGTGANLISWLKLLVIQGVPTGTYAISREQLTLQDGASVIWDTINGSQMALSWPWSVGWKGSAAAGTVPLTITGGGYALTFHVEEDGFYVKLNGAVIFSISETYKSNNWWTVALTPGKINVTLSRLIGGLYPDETLYPEETLYPKPEYYSNTKTVEAALEIPEFEFGSAALGGYQVCDFLWVTAGTIDESTVSDMMNVPDFEPERDADTYMLADFKNGLLAGNLPSIGEDITGYSVYRQGENDRVLEHVGNFPITTSQFLDYSARSQVQYTYYMRAIGANTFATLPLISAPIRGVFWSWSILEAQMEDDGLLHVIREFRFRLNLSSGTVGNNNAPQTLQNFTPYPIVQPMTSNYQSGTLSALLGKIEYNGGVPAYVNTREARDELTSLSATANTLILKNPIGDLFPIRTGGAITVRTDDKTREQVMTISLPWVQTAEKPEAAVVSTPDDSFWSKWSGEVNA